MLTVKCVHTVVGVVLFFIEVWIKVNKPSSICHCVSCARLSWFPTNTWAYFSAVSINDTQFPIKNILGGFFKGSLSLLEMQSSSKTNTENHRPRKTSTINHIWSCVLKVKYQHLTVLHVLELHNQRELSHQTEFNWGPAFMYFTAILNSV